MPPEIITGVASLAVLLSAVLAVAFLRRNRVDGVRAALGVPADADVERAVKELVDARAAAELERDRSAREISRLLDLLGVGVLRLDGDLVIRLANRAAHRFLGRRPGGLAGQTAMEAFGDHRVEDVVREAAGAGVASGELIVPGPTERVLSVRAEASVAGGTWVVLEDVSELRRLRRIRAEFVDNLSHELRTPLSTVRLLTETVLRDLDGADVPPRIRERILKIDVETGHLVQMVNELLDLSRIEQGGTRLHVGDVDLAGVVRGAVERLRPFGDRQRVTLRAELPPNGDLPEIRGDDERLGQLLVNLLHNAIKFSPPGRAVVVRVEPRDGEVVMEVADEGAGIPRGDLDRVFERFYKVDKARVRGKGGTGLGLSIARHIAESHGGRIWVESEEGKGSTFYVAVPAEPVVT
jgi:two-component system, OmpR family, phosphate regulon sensor histidine kinase PhoR